MIKKIVFSFLVLVGYTMNLAVSQDAIVLDKALEDQKKSFQEFFFKALSERAINNPKKAIQNLEECLAIDSLSTGVLFELAKNYVTINRLTPAKDYIVKALKAEPNNVWMLAQLVTIYKRSYKYKDAIIIQKQLVVLDIKHRENLVLLFVNDKQYKKAQELITVLKKESAFSSRMVYLEKQIATILKPKTPKLKVEEKEEVRVSGNEEASYIKNKSFLNLKRLLENTTLLKKLQYGDEGIALYPAQPAIYLLYSKALIQNKAYKKALETLDNGIDFVIDDTLLEISFLKQKSKCYKALGKHKLARTMMQKAKKLE